MQQATQSNAYCHISKKGTEYWWVGDTYFVLNESPSEHGRPFAKIHSSNTTDSQSLFESYFRKSSLRESSLEEAYQRFLTAVLIIAQKGFQRNSITQK